MSSDCGARYFFYLEGYPQIYITHLRCICTLDKVALPYELWYCTCSWIQTIKPKNSHSSNNLMLYISSLFHTNYRGIM